MARILVAYGSMRVQYDKDKNPVLGQHILGTVFDAEQALTAAGHTARKCVISRNPVKFIREFHRFKPHAIFNLCESVAGDAGQEKNVAALFEMLKARFTGNGPMPLTICQNKAFTKRILKSAGIPTPPFAVVTEDLEIELPFELPAMVKPVREDGSVGITARSFVKTQKRLAERIRYIKRNFGQPALIEKYAPGREFQVSVMGNSSPEVLAIAELSYKGLPRHLPRICTYAAKWDTNSSYYKCTNPIIPARAGEKTEKKLVDISLRIFEIFNMRGYARVDFRVYRNKPTVIDINPNPDFSADAGFARAAAWAGFPYPALANRLVELALE